MLISSAQKHQPLVKNIPRHVKLTKIAQKGLICAEKGQYFLFFLS